MPYFAQFEIDIVHALAEQLVAALDALTPEALAPAQIQSMEPGQGIYALYRNGALVYIGKAKELRDRLDDHYQKISGRRNISLNEMTFCALYVHKNWTALAPEESLIRHFKGHGAACTWNGISFGPHDPGRNRELTNKRPDGFDIQHPIIDDLPCNWIQAGQWNIKDLLIALKTQLPYLLRYECTTSYRTGHPDYNGIILTVPNSGMSAKALLKLIADAIGWQADVFPSHMILYKEKRKYDFSQTL